jgi:proline iminopeptidase
MSNATPVLNKLYPEIEPYQSGYLRVSDLHDVFYEQVGTPGGQPAVFLHGGPGVGIMPGYRRFFDPKQYRMVLLDQRGAGRSKPHAELAENTTWDLVEDLEKLRSHLGIDRWVVFGGSWGSTLALCYAIKHPDRVRGLILRGVYLGRPQENHWLHQHGMSEIYPDEWERYIQPIPPGERGDLLKAYHERLTTGSLDDQLKFAAAWSRWEAATMTVVPDPKAIDDFTDPHMGLSIARIECYYTLNSCFLPTDNYILENAQTIRSIPLRIVQGRYDVICPVRSAWDLHQALPHSDLRIVPLGAHSPMDDGMVHELVQATQDFRKLS